MQIETLQNLPQEQVIVTDSVNRVSREVGKLRTPVESPNYDAVFSNLLALLPYADNDKYKGIKPFLNIVKTIEPIKDRLTQDIANDMQDFSVEHVEGKVPLLTFFNLPVEATQTWLDDYKPVLALDRLKPMSSSLNKAQIRNLYGWYPEKLADLLFDENLDLKQILDIPESINPRDNPQIFLDTFFDESREVSARELNSMVQADPSLEHSLPLITIQAFKHCIVILTQAFPEQDFSNITSILNIRQFISRTKEITSSHDAYGSYNSMQVDRPMRRVSPFARASSAIQNAERFLDLATVSLQVLDILEPNALTEQPTTTTTDTQTPDAPVITPPGNLTPPPQTQPDPPPIVDQELSPKNEEAGTFVERTIDRIGRIAHRTLPTSKYIGVKMLLEKATNLLKKKGATPEEKALAVRNLMGIAQDRGMNLSEDDATRMLENNPEQLEPDVQDLSKRRTLQMLALGAAGLLVSKDHPKSPSPVLSRGNPKTETSQEPTSPIEEFLKPFITEAMEKRAQRAKNDPEYSRRVDQDLNSSRVNVLIWGYSEEHGSTYEEYDGAPSVLSYDLKTGKIGVVHLSRDIRVPEITQIKPDATIEDQRIRTIFKYGGFPFLQKTAESITGLAIDYQIVMKDVVLRDVIEQIAGGKLNIDVNKDHDTGHFRLDGIEYGDGLIHKGLQEMNTALLMRYVLAEDKNPGGKEDERSYRKNKVLNALSNQFKEHIKTNPATFLYFLNLLRKEIDGNNVQVDFSLGLLSRGTQVVQGAINTFLTYMSGQQTTESKIPYVDHDAEIVFHDPFFGDGGVRRVHSIRDNTDVAMLYPESIVTETQNKLPDWMLIPEGGDPYSNDLIANYWKSIRTMVKRKLQRLN